MLDGIYVLIIRFLLHLVTPLVHPLHTLNMGLRDEACLSLQLLELLVMLLLLQLLRSLQFLITHKNDEQPSSLSPSATAHAPTPPHGSSSTPDASSSSRDSQVPFKCEI
jgi:hypothetical protein